MDGHFKKHTSKLQSKLQILNVTRASKAILVQLFPLNNRTCASDMCWGEFYRGEDSKTVTHAGNGFQVQFCFCIENDSFWISLWNCTKLLSGATVSKEQFSTINHTAVKQVIKISWTCSWKPIFWKAEILLHLFFFAKSMVGRKKSFVTLSL